MHMERKFMKRLLEWKDSTQKMPMLLFGAKSIKMYMNKYQPEYAIRCSLKNFGYRDGVLYFLLYALFCL